MPEHDTVAPAYRGILYANSRYARSFDKGDLALPLARRIAILTCMDARPIRRNLPGWRSAMPT